MKVWLVTIGEPLPVGKEDVRLLRTGILAQELAARGHQVLWWSSTFSHTQKKHLFMGDQRMALPSGGSLHLLHAPAYRSNVSIRRILNHIELARKFRKLSRQEETPDVILCSMPTIELSREAARYGRRRGVPVVLDIRDMWPDIFLSRVPDPLKSLFKVPLFFMVWQLRQACRQATAISGITPGYLDWALKYAHRGKGSLDRDFPHGYSSTPPEPAKIALAESFWRRQGIARENGEFVVCLFSSIVRQLDLETVIEAARRLQNTGRRFRFVFCGTGDALEYFQGLAKGCHTVCFPGWVHKPEIHTLMKLSQVGLAPYHSTKDFVISIPNKAIEYMSAGLPLVSSLRGTLQELLAKHEAGLTYANHHPDELASLLCTLYDQPEKLAAMSRNSLSLYQQRFNAEKVYAEMCAYLEEMAASRLAVK